MSANLQTWAVEPGSNVVAPPAFWPEGIGQRVGGESRALLARLEPFLPFMEDAALNEKILWELAAAGYSPAWATARDALRDAETHLQNILSPHNEPLGAIGAALDYEEVNAAHEQLRLALAAFTILNEGLYQDQAMRDLFDAVCAQGRLVETARSRLRNLRDITEKTAPAIAISHSPGPLHAMFRQYAARLFHKGETP